MNVKILCDSRRVCAVYEFHGVIMCDFTPDFAQKFEILHTVYHLTQSVWHFCCDFNFVANYMFRV